MVSSICFSGCGWAFIYYLGIAKFIQETFNLEETVFLGVSGGCIPSIFLAMGYNIDDLFHTILPLAQYCNSGYFNTSFYSEKLIDEILYKLPNNICDLIKDRVKFSVSKLPWLSNELLENFDNKNELKEAVICSCYSPIFFPNRIAKYRDNYYIDGMISNDSPKLDKNTILISAFFNKDFCNSNTFKLFSSFYYPGDFDNLHEIYSLGQADAIKNINLFLERNFKFKNNIENKYRNVSTLSKNNSEED